MSMGRARKLGRLIVSVCLCDRAEFTPIRENLGHPASQREAACDVCVRARVPSREPAPSSSHASPRRSLSRPFVVRAHVITRLRKPSRATEGLFALSPIVARFLVWKKVYFRARGDASGFPACFSSSGSNPKHAPRAILAAASVRPLSQLPFFPSGRARRPPRPPLRAPTSLPTTPTPPLHVKNIFVSCRLSTGLWQLGHAAPAPPSPDLSSSSQHE